MIITKKYAQRLIRAGKAEQQGAIVADNGHIYKAVIRYDLQRVDHYRES